MNKALSILTFLVLTISYLAGGYILGYHHGYNKGTKDGVDYICEFIQTKDSENKESEQKKAEPPSIQPDKPVEPTPETKPKPKHDLSRFRL